MRFGTFVTEPTPWPLQTSTFDATQTTAMHANPSFLYSIALQWLTEDREYRRELEKQGKKTRGARREEVCEMPSIFYLLSHQILQPVPSDSGTFYNKSDLIHLILETSLTLSQIRL